MESIYRVTVSEEVHIALLAPDAPDRPEARDVIIHRESLAIEHFHDNVAEETLPGNYYFATLDAARSFALLCLKARQQHLVANMDRVLDFDGS